jgi:hypothetical protein
MLLMTGRPKDLKMNDHEMGIAMSKRVIDKEGHIQKHLNSSCCGNTICHSREGGNSLVTPRTPVSAGVTREFSAHRNRN